MRFADPWFLLLLAGPLALAMRMALRRRRPPEHRIGFPALGFLDAEPAGRGARWRLLPDVLRLAALSLLIVALARPQVPHEVREVRSKARNLMLALDISSSMKATDFKPGNRLEVARQVLGDFARRRHGDLLGLVIFAGRSFLQAPLTPDTELLGELLGRVEIGQLPDGTGIGTALALCLSQLKDLPNRASAIVLITDGANNTGSPGPFVAAEAARAIGVRIHTIGVSAPDTSGFDDGFIWRQGRTPDRLTSSDEEVLRRIADRSGGEYFRATDPQALERIMERLDPLEREEVRINETRDYRELFPWVLAPALRPARGRAGAPHGQARSAAVTGGLTSPIRGYCWPGQSCSSAPRSWLSAVSAARRAALERFGDLAVLERGSSLLSVRQASRQWALRLAALGLGVLALARPQAGERQGELVRTGRDVLVLLDLSRSMGVSDVSTGALAGGSTRLAAAKQLAWDVMATYPSDRVGLVVFGGSAFLQLPLTSDRASLKLFLDAASSDDLGDPATDVSAALLTAVSAFEHEGETGRRAVLHRHRRRERGGRPRRGRRSTPGRGAAGVRDRRGHRAGRTGAGGQLRGPRPVPPRPHRPGHRLAAGGGRSPPCRRGKRRSVRALGPARGDAGADRGPGTGKAADACRPQVDRAGRPLPVAACCSRCCCCSPPSASERRASPANRPPATGPVGRRGERRLPRVCCSPSHSRSPAHRCTRASGSITRASIRRPTRSSGTGSSATAARASRSDAGSALYRLERYDEAVAAFRQASRNPELRQRSLFNLGNALVRAAEERPGEAQPLLDAVAVYEEALRLAPGDPDARWNLEIALRSWATTAPAAARRVAGARATMVGATTTCPATRAIPMRRSGPWPVAATGRRRGNRWMS